MEASYEVLRAGLKMRMAQLEEERAARAEEVERKMEWHHHRECSSDGTAVSESDSRKKGTLSQPSAAVFVFGGKSKERTKTSSTSSSFESARSRSSLESNGSRRSAGSTRAGMPLPPCDPADQKLKQSFITPSPPLPVEEPPRNWRTVTRRQSSSDEKTPVLTEEDLEDLDSSDTSSDASSAVWDSDVEADLEVEFENAKARALHCIKSGTAPGALVSPVK
eukprot:TRINITY_DN23563_c0_g1_i1.p1 TRINITY_DN23563_c0_g1~~TRINITY_DN23563_c0_g1_i1.p1  ORF type:complete len:244 (+),score=61.54 TRINITY_DN23563_c0_g1_i1:72-734(+)